MNRLLIVVILLGTVIALISGIWGTVAFVAGLGLALATKRDD